MEIDDTPTAASHDNEGEDDAIYNYQAMLQKLGVDSVAENSGKENYRPPEKPKATMKAPAKKKSGTKGKGTRAKTKGGVAMSKQGGGATPSIPHDTLPSDLVAREQANGHSTSTSHAIPSHDSVPNSLIQPPRRMTHHSVKDTCVDTEESMKLVSADQHKWMMPALEALISALGPAQENGIVDLWLTFESLMKPQELKKKLTLNEWPWQLSDWIS